MKQNQFKFKPFDQVLVRDVDEDIWRISLYSHFDNDHLHNPEYPHFCINECFKQCIPYNEETAHLLGTNEPYREPEPIEWYVDSINGPEKYNLTSKQFEQFLTNTVVKNKDIIEFRVRYTPK